jgi:Protein of unknown function (DUF2442)
MSPRVLSATPLKPFCLQLGFADGKKGMLDITPYLHYPAFACLKDPAFFMQAKASHGTVEWPNGVDFDPDTLYLSAVQFHD